MKKEPQFSWISFILTALAMGAFFIIRALNTEGPEFCDNPPPGEPVPVICEPASTF